MTSEDGTRSCSRNVVGKYLGIFQKTCRENFFNVTRIKCALHEFLRVFMILSLTIVLTMQNISDKICRENQNKISCSVTFLLSKITTSPPHFFLFNIITAISFGEKYKPWSFFLCRFIECFFASPLFIYLWLILLLHMWVNFKQKLLHSCFTEYIEERIQTLHTAARHDGQPDFGEWIFLVFFSGFIFPRIYI